MHDSASRSARRSRSSSATCSSIDEPSALNTNAPVASTRPPTSASRAASAPGRWRTSISSSPRRRQVVISSGERSVSASISRRVLAISDSGIPNIRTVWISYGRPGRAPLGTAVGLERLRPHRVQLARRAREHDHRRPVVDGDHQPRGGPRRVDRLGALGTIACFRFASRSASASKFIRRANSGEDRGDLLLHRLVEHQLDARRSGRRSRR